MSTLPVNLLAAALLALGAVLFAAAGAVPASGAEDDEAVPAAGLDAALWLLQRRRPLGPHAPPPPEVAAASATSLTATWTAPEDADDIVDYDVQYRADGARRYIDREHAGTATRSAISGLVEDTTYQVRVRAGNDMGAGDWSEPGSGTTPEARPAFAEGDSARRELEENAAPGTAIGAPLTATYATRYALGGTDAASFSIDAAGGQLRARADVSYDHERRAEYAVTVTAHGERARAAHIAVSIAVLDVDEPPGAPAAPTVKPVDGYQTRVTVTWTAPENTGPAITDYDVQHRAEGEEEFTDAGYDGRGFAATVTDLRPDTAYGARVRARNAEGPSRWSLSGRGTTSANQPPAFLEPAPRRFLREDEGPGEDIGAPVRANDPNGDPLTYRLGGLDAALFGIEPDTGQLTTASGAGYDHEARDSHELTVTAEDRHGGRAAVDVTITVTDVPEPPRTPLAPAVTSSTRSSLDVVWTAPENAGRPVIDDYDVRYRVDGLGAFRDWDHAGAGTRATIASLDASTDYEVQVRAKNDEGTSRWSPSVVGRTELNRAPTFAEGPSAVRELRENAAAETDVGAPVRATDVDGGTLRYGLEGPDAASFAFDADTGQLKTRANVSYDYEKKDSYDVTVTVADGQGGSASIDVTVAVTDLEEPPGTPQAPVVSATSSTSLTARWTAPENTGPEILDYDHRHKVEGSLDWAGVSTVADTETAIEGLTPATGYEVQVRAANAEGTGAWSPSGRGVTSPSGPDLEVGAATVSNSSPETEASFTLSATVSNRGGASAAATTLHYYRSADAMISASDIEVGTDAVEALSASSSSARSVSLTAPSTADTYYYGACVDAVTGESSATNNCSSSAQVDVTEPPPPSNRRPEAVGQIASRTLEAGGSETLDVSSRFSDPDNDELAYAAASSDVSVATARASGSAVTVTAVASGEAVVTVTASDPGGLTAEQGIAVTVAAQNRPPIATKTIPDQTIHVWGELQTLPSSKNRFEIGAIHNYFSDPDGDPLRYQASSSDRRYATVRTSIIPALNHYQMVVDPVAVGQATITLTATDPEGLNANYVFGVNVSPPLPNRRPVVQWPIGTRQVYVGVPDVLRLRDHFRDEDVYGSYFQLNYAVSSADNGIALVRVWDKRDHETGHGYARLVIEGVSAGETTATVVATDRAGLSVSHTFKIIAETRPPRVTRRISDVSVSAGVETYVRDLNSYFTDPDGYDLVYGASSSDTVVVRARISRHGPYVVLSAREVGTADIAVTATDVTGLTASQTFTVTVVSPRPPTITRRISDRSVYVGRETYVYSLQNYFADPEGRELVYDASSSDTSVVRASVGEDNPYIVVLFAREVGTADVTVTATDVTGLTASQTFTVTVSAAPSGGRGFSDSRPM